jgi:hypothetical protein
MVTWWYGRPVDNNERMALDELDGEFGPRLGPPHPETKVSSDEWLPLPADYAAELEQRHLLMPPRRSRVELPHADGVSGHVRNGD